MSVSKPIAFIIGYGSGVGTAVARKFKAEGFNVAVSGRSLDKAKLQASEGLLGVKLDVSNAKDIAGAFGEVEKAFGGPPNTVIFNVGNATWAQGGPADPLSLPFDDFVKDVIADGVNAYEIIKLAKAGFDKLPQDQEKTFIATGNLCPWELFPAMLGLSVGKRALANIVEVCAGAYSPTGQRFYYAFEVSQEGGPAMPPDGPSHAKVFYDLYKQKEQGAWDVRFTKGGELYKGPTKTSPLCSSFATAPKLVTAVARKFKAEGSNVAVAERGLDLAKLQVSEGILGINLDVSNAKDIPGAFGKVEKAFGGPPGTVIFNVGNGTWAQGGLADPLSLPFDDFVKDVLTDGVNAYEIIKLAKTGFDKLPEGQAGLFIGTGNLCPWDTVHFRAVLGLSVGKRALAHIIEVCAAVYGPSGQRFYFPIEVTPEGGSAIPPDGPSHGKVFYDLYQQKEQGVWDIRFTKGGELWNGGTSSAL